MGTLPDMDSAVNSTGGEGPDPGLPPRRLLLRRWRAAQLICEFALLACWAAAQHYGARADWPVGALIVIAFSALLAGWIALTLSPVHWIGYRGPWVALLLGSGFSAFAAVPELLLRLAR